jgi:predicted LPLAT superfamily acyltransferase
MIYKDIDRHVIQGTEQALDRVSFCLDEIEKYGVDFDTYINKRLTMEEIVGALVSAEQYIKDIIKEQEYEQKNF